MLLHSDMAPERKYFIGNGLLKSGDKSQRKDHDCYTDCSSEKREPYHNTGKIITPAVRQSFCYEGAYAQFMYF